MFFRLGFGFGGTGKKSNNRQFDNYGEAFGKCDVITCLLDADNGEVRFYKNGVDLGKAFTVDKNLIRNGMFPAVVLKVGIILCHLKFVIECVSFFFFFI